MKNFYLLAALFTTLLCGCSESTPILPSEEFESTNSGLFIGSEGAYMSANASLSYYLPTEKRVENEVFLRANGQLLGDTTSSLQQYDNRLWICVNNSGVIFAIDPTTFREVGRITLTAPRHICFVSPTKAYVSQLWDNRIAIINPQNYTITGYVDTDMSVADASTEQMVLWNGYLFVNCWSYQKQILKIDTATDTVVGKLEVGIQPTTMLRDKHNKLWTLTDGGQWEGNPIGYEAPTLVRIDPESLTIEQRFTMSLGEFPSRLQLDSTGEWLYWLNGGVWKMSVEAAALPSEPELVSGIWGEYGLTIDPENGDIYVADAIDYAQNGVVIRYSASGEELDRFGVGICPSTFCWKR